MIIKKLIAGGKGLGARADGLAIMVPGVLAGETVRVREIRERRGYAEAELIEICAASGERITPPCPHYGDCGGCDLQHAAYPAQLAIKEAILAESLARAGIVLDEDRPAPVLASPEPFAYRHRLRLHLGGEGALGFHRGASHQVVPIEQCLLATEPLNRIIAALAQEGWGSRLGGLARSLELIQCPDSGRTCLVIEPAAKKAVPAMRPHFEALAELADLILVRGARSAGSRNEEPPFAQTFRLLGLEYRLAWDQHCFFQVNVRQNAQLLALALAPLAGAAAPFTALDLYCGMGNFSIPLSLLGGQVTGVEHNPHSLAWASHNGRACAPGSLRFLAGDVEARLKSLAERGERFDCVLLDPPRQGLGKAANLLPRLAAKRIISISCDPATHARDLALIIAHGYRLTAIRAVDMFPQTHHIESLALLERN